MGWNVKRFITSVAILPSPVNAGNLSSSRPLVDCAKRPIIVGRPDKVFQNFHRPIIECLFTARIPLFIKSLRLVTVFLQRPALVRPAPANSKQEFPMANLIPRDPFFRDL